MRNMPDHITDSPDEFDNQVRDGIMTFSEERQQEDRAISIIHEALLNGDTFKSSVGRYTYDFSEVIEDHLSNNSDFTNALRKLMIGDKEEAVATIRDIINKATIDLAESIYHDLQS